jgi:NADH-quinone oxidoreductase subunit L
MRLMGGLRKRMPITFACMLICTLAIAGVPLFSGFYSKDKIIQAGWLRVLDKEHFDGWSLYALFALSCAAALTAFYMFRLVFLTFYGEYRGNQAQHRFSAQLAAEGVEGPDPNEHAEPVEHAAAHGAHADAHAHDHAHGGRADEHGHAHHAPAAKTAHVVHAMEHDPGSGHAEHGHHEPHESPEVITVALMILAFLGLFGGHFWLTAPQAALTGHPWFESLVTESSMYGREISEWLSPEPASEEARAHHADLHHLAHNLAVGLSITVALLGILTACLLYLWRPGIPGRVVAFLGQAYTAVRRRYYVDELVDATVIRSTWGLTHAQKWLDENVVDGGVRLVGGLNALGGTFAAWFDRVFIDGAVNAVALASQVFGAAFRLVQTGRIQQYAAFAVGGAVLTAAWLILA